MNIRRINYSVSNVIIMCFSVASPSSFENISSKWLPEAQKEAAGLPIILCGLKTDLRSDPDAAKTLANKNQRMVSQFDAEELAKKIGAVRYMECSALLSRNLNELFEEAARVGLNHHNTHSSSGCCSIM